MDASSLRKSQGRVLILCGISILVLGAGTWLVKWIEHQLNTAPMVEEALSEVTNPVVWIWSGDPGHEGFRTRFRLHHAHDPVVLRVGSSPALTNARVFPAVRVEGAGARAVYDVRPRGLEGGRRWYYAVEADGEVDLGKRGSIQLPEAGPQSFAFAFSNCARTGSNAPVFDAIRERRPLAFLHLGDLHYANVEENDPEAYWKPIETVLQTPRQAQLYRDTAVDWVWDDHDFGPNNSDSTSPGKEAAQRVYRLAAPHPPLAHDRLEADHGPIHHEFSIGRVRFLVTDCRSERSPRSVPIDERSMLGDDQRRWLRQRLRTAVSDGTPVVFWISSVPWIAAPDEDGDHWGAYGKERRELCQYVESLDLPGLFMLCGDAHMLAFDDGTHNRYTPSKEPGFPVLHGGSLDKNASYKGGPYSGGARPGGGQFGWIEVADDGGERITVRYAGLDAGGEVLLETDFEVELR